MDLHQRLKLARERIGKSQKLLAEALGIGLRSWQGYEDGSNVPGGNVLEGLARLGININWLLTGEGEMTRTVRLTESESHMVLRERLRSSYRSFDRFECGFYGLDVETVRAYAYSDYLPTNSELEAICKLAGGLNFETGKMATRNEEAEKEIEKRITEYISSTIPKKIDIELLKLIFIEAEKAMNESSVFISPENKAKLFSIVYDETVSSEDMQDVVKQKIGRLLRLVR